MRNKEMYCNCQFAHEFNKKKKIYSSKWALTETTKEGVCVFCGHYATNTPIELCKTKINLNYDDYVECLKYLDITQLRYMRENMEEQLKACGKLKEGVKYKADSIWKQFNIINEGLK